MRSVEILFDEEVEYCYKLSSIGLEDWELLIYKDSLIFSSLNNYIELSNKQEFINYLKSQTSSCILQFEDSRLELNKDQINLLLRIFTS